jgi:Carboxypeptidase regulatory-like domain
MLETLAWIGLLMAGSAVQNASRAGGPVLPQTQVAHQEKQSNIATTGAFRITGRVVNSMTNAPVAGAYVVINAASASNFSRTVRAGTDGSFAFTQILAGRYVLMARRKGYIEQMFLQHEQFTTAILVGPSLNSENLVFPLAPEGVISGEVTDEAGEPVQSAKMLLFREDAGNGRHMKRFKEEQNTDEEGRYRFGSLPSGDYYLAVSAEPWYAQYARSHSSWIGTSAAAQEPEIQNSGLDLVYPITYYPNATEVSGAASIRVDAGGSARADVRLVPVPALRLRLEVDKIDLRANREILVSQTILGTYPDEERVSSGLTMSTAAFQDGEDGSASQLSGPVIMEVDGLRPGLSSVEIITGKPGKAFGSDEVKKSVRVDPAGGQTIDVGGIAPSGVVSGTVKLEGNASVPPGVLVFLREESNGRAFRQDVDSAGNFRFFADELEPGVYEVSSAAPGGLELRSVSASGTKVTGRKIEIGNGSDLRLTLTLARGVNAGVKGIVERGGKPAPGMMVVLVPEDLRDLAEYRRDQSDSDGSFSMDLVSPGKYTVVALKDWDLEWGNPEVIQGYLAGGTSVEVGGGEEREIKVTAK